MKDVVLCISALTLALMLCSCTSDPPESSASIVEVFSQSCFSTGLERPLLPTTVVPEHDGSPSFPKPILERDAALQTSLGLSRKGINALVFLKYSTLFATYPRVGRSGRFPCQIFAFQSLLSEPNADAAFAHLVECDFPSGELYGLCGLYFTDPSRFRNEVERLRNSHGAVFIMQESVAQFVEAGDLVLSESPLAIRLSSPSVRLESWYPDADGSRAAPRDSDALPVLDIAGGGYPCFLRAIRPPSARTPETAFGRGAGTSPESLPGAACPQGSLAAL